MRQLVGEENFHNNHISRIVLIKKFFIRNNLAHKYKACTAAAYYECSTFSCSLHNIPLSSPLLPPRHCVNFSSVLPFIAHFYAHMVKVKYFFLFAIIKIILSLCLHMNILLL